MPKYKKYWEPITSLSVGLFSVAIADSYGIYAKRAMPLSQVGIYYPDGSIRPIKCGNNRERYFVCRSGVDAQRTAAGPCDARP
jgi:hypothetical protein